MRRRSQFGFTLIELIVCIVLMGIVSVVASRIMLQGFQTFVTAQNINEADWQGLLALEMLTNDIHTIRSASSITTTSASSLVFTNVSGTSVTYALSGTNLQRNSVTVASGITSLAFTYLNQNGAVTATPSLVRYITISVTAAQNNLSMVFTTMVGTRGML